MSNKLKTISFLIVPMVVLLVIVFINRDDLFKSKEPKEYEKPITERLNLLIIEPDFLNPLISKNKYVQDTSKLVFEGLSTINSELRAEPLTARFILPDIGLINWEVTLKDNVYFHNGEKLSTDDVIFTVNKIKKLEKDSYFEHNVQNIDKIEKISDEKFIIRLKTSDNFLIDKLTFPILSEKAYLNEDLSKTNIYVGTGPYMQESYSEGKIILKRFNKYHRETTGNIESINVKILDKARPGFELLKSGEIDIADTNTEVGAYGRSAYSSGKYIDGKFTGLIFNTNVDILSDKNVRQAVLLGINRDMIIERFLSGYGMSRDLPINPTSYLYNNNIMIYAYNPERARDLLNNSEWSLKGNTREKNGKRLNIKFLVNLDNDKNLEKAQYIKENLADIGINLDIITKSSGDYAVSIANRDYDIALTEWAISTYPEFLYKFDSNSADNIFKFDNKDYDYLTFLAKNETVKEKLQEHFFMMQEILSEELPIAGLYFETSTVYYGKKVKWNVNAMFNIYADIENAIIDESADI